ncbi:MAG: hypothetical protein ACE5GJ_13075 [Gemmatimonadota bacterium]
MNEPPRRENRKERDPGVPEALPRVLEELRSRVRMDTLDRLWIFPPIRSGRRERGVVAASVFLPDAPEGNGDAEERRRVLTVSYTAERTGRDLKVEPAFHEEGEAPPDMLSRVMEGVVRRAGAEGQGDPRLVEVGRDPGVFQELVAELSPDPEAWGVSSS